MVNLKPTVALLQNTSYVKADGTCGISLRVTYARKKRYFRLPINLTIDDFKKATSPKPRGVHKQQQLELKVMEAKALEIIDSIEDFSFEKFEKYFYSNSSAKYSLSAAYQNYIGELEKDGRVKTASNYNSSIKSLIKYKQNLTFKDIDVSFLNKYEKWALDNGKSINTIGIYLRPLKHIFNVAIAEGHIKPEQYPFGRGKYIIPYSKGKKLALDTPEIKLLADVELPKSSKLKQALDYWFFMFIANGMNMADMAKLKYSHLKDDRFDFIREKTKRTRRVSTRITVMRTAELNRIVEEWGNKKLNDNTYIFPILDESITDEKVITRAIDNATNSIRKNLKKVCKRLGLSKQVSTLTARHSSATTLMRNNIEVALISEALGHSSIKTTENYLGDFEVEAKIKVANILSDLIQGGK